MGEIRKILNWAGLVWFISVGLIAWFVFHENWGPENTIAVFVFGAPGVMMFVSAAFLGSIKSEPDSPSEPS